MALRGDARRRAPNSSPDAVHPWLAYTDGQCGISPPRVPSPSVSVPHLALTYFAHGRPHLNRQRAARRTRSPRSGNRRSAACVQTVNVARSVEPQMQQSSVTVNVTVERKSEVGSWIGSPGCKSRVLFAPEAVASTSANTAIKCGNKQKRMASWGRLGTCRSLAARCRRRPAPAGRER